MSRVGKMIIEIPEKVSIKLNDSFVGITGPKGSINVPFHSDMKLKLDDKRY